MDLQQQAMAWICRRNCIKLKKIYDRTDLSKAYLSIWTSIIYSTFILGMVSYSVIIDQDDN